MSTSPLQTEIERLYEIPAAELPDNTVHVVAELRQRLTAGEVRAAEPTGDGWTVNDWVKKGILLGFRVGQIEDYSINPIIARAALTGMGLVSMKLTCMSPSNL